MAWTSDRKTYLRRYKKRALLTAPVKRRICDCKEILPLLLKESIQKVWTPATTISDEWHFGIGCNWQSGIIPKDAKWESACTSNDRFLVEENTSNTDFWDYCIAEHLSFFG